jgi:hypothetical protein
MDHIIQYLEFLIITIIIIIYGLGINYLCE